MKTKEWGLTLLVLGVGSFILPLLGVQFQIFNLLQAAQPGAGIAFAAVGAVLFLFSLRKGTAKPKLAAPARVAVAASPQAPGNSAAAAVGGPESRMFNPGATVARFCGYCGAALHANGAFCGNCGAPRAQGPFVERKSVHI